MRTSATIALALALLAGCGDSASGNKTTTKLDAVEVQPGTISDSMIILDDSSIDGTAVDNRIPVDPNAKSEEKVDEADKADKPESEATSDVEAPAANAPGPEKK